MYRILKRCQCKCHAHSKRFINSASRNNPWRQQDQLKQVEINIDNKHDRVMKISSGQYARFTDGCAVAKVGDTSVMVTAVSRKSTSSANFLPLTVDYREKAAAAGRIPTNYLRRELGPSDREILTSRMIDRSIRPLFPQSFNSETQLMCNLLAVDSYNDPDIVSINAASAALSLSDIPWDGPVGAVRVGYIDKLPVINPTRKELANSQLNLVVSATKKKKLVMLDGSADGIPYFDFSGLVSRGVKETQVIIHQIEQLQKKYGVEKRPVPETQPVPAEIIETIERLSVDRLVDVFTDYTHHKISRDEATRAIQEEVVTFFLENNQSADAGETYDQSKINNIVSDVSKRTFRRLILDNSTRCDGRGLSDLRPITCDVDLFKPLHGSSLFQRGQTQVLSTVTFDSPESAAKVNPISAIMSGIKEKNFFLHYEFPPYATNEIGRGGVARRELGHGNLAERGIRAVVPSDFPFTIRLSAEVLESNGSSSMATVCGGSLALMDAGVPLKEAVAGVAVGVITETDPESNKITNYKVLTDLLGIEDYLGDMDFKMAGTRTGVTAIQSDVKIPGMSMDIISDAITQGSEGINKILDIMAVTQKAPRLQKKENHPVTETIDVPIVKKAKFLGHGGNNIKKITAETGVTITATDDTNFRVFAPNQDALDEAKEMIEELLTEEREPTLEFGAIYTAKIVEILDRGVMVQLYPTMTPTLIHNTQLDQRRISHASALDLQVGQEISVKYFGRDPASGKMRLSRKALLFTATPNIIKNLQTKRT